MTSRAPVEVSGFNAAPEFAHGLVRDIRIRWACEEIDQPYRMRLLDGSAARPKVYFREQPFGQVPALRDGDIHLFESGAILLYLGERDERLLPKEPSRRGRTVSWLFAALSSVEPALMNLVAIDFFSAGEEWAKLGRPAAGAYARSRLQHLSEWLGEKAWLEGRFSLADLMMVSVLRTVRHTGLVGEFPNLSAYQARGEARPAFGRALAAQLADFGMPARQ